MTFSVTLSWIFAGNVFTALLGLAVFVFFLLHWWEIACYERKFDFGMFLLTISGAIVTIVAAFNIYYGG